jgi:rubredoxin
VLTAAALDNGRRAGVALSFTVAGVSGYA